MAAFLNTASSGRSPQICLTYLSHLVWHRSAIAWGLGITHVRLAIALLVLCVDMHASSLRPRSVPSIWLLLIA